MKARLGFVGVLVLLVVFAVASGYTVEMSAAGKEKISPYLKMQLGKSKSDPPARAGLLAQASGKRSLVRTLSRNGEPAFGVFIRSSATRQELQSLGAEVKTWTPGVCTAVVPLSALAGVVESAKVTWVEPGVLTRPLLDVSCAASGAPYQGINARAAYSHWTGAGVVVGIVDSGVDFTHGDFIDDSTGKSRLLNYWDQNLTPEAGESSPLEFGYGVEYTQSQLNNEIDGSPAGFVRAEDPDGHGTHVAGIAAGDGSYSDGTPPAGTYTGVAPGADIIAVATTFYSDEVVDGVDYVFRRAAAMGKPAVVNLSLGTHFGPHDGTSSFETALDNLQGVGKMVVCAAGNERADQTHAEAHVGSGGNVTVTVVVPGIGLFLDAIIDIWYDGGDRYNVVVTTPGAASTSVCAPGGTLDETPGGEGEVVIFNTDLNNPNNGDGNISIDIFLPDSGTWQIRLTRVALGGDGDFDAWLTPVVLLGDPAYFSSHVTDEELVGMPATHPNLLAVAAHMTKVQWTTSGGSVVPYPGGPYNLGDLAYFSSPGPSRDTTSDPGYQKPDICAPGMVIASAMSKDATFDPLAIVDDSYHVILQGTSMAAPHVTGAVALLFDRTGTLTPQEVRSVMTSTAYTDVYTGAVPNYDFGYGKLNTYAMATYTAARFWNLYE